MNDVHVSSHSGVFICNMSHTGPTILPQNFFHPVRDMETLHNAMDGIGKCTTGLKAKHFSGIIRPNFSKYTEHFRNRGETVKSPSCAGGLLLKGLCFVSVMKTKYNQVLIRKIPFYRLLGLKISWAKPELSWAKFAICRNWEMQLSPTHREISKNYWPLYYIYLLRMMLTAFTKALLWVSCIYCEPKTHWVISLLVSGGMPVQHIQ